VVPPRLRGIQLSNSAAIQAAAAAEFDLPPVTRTFRSFPILPRSRQRPVASTDGSVTENLNKTGVRLWTAPPLAVQSKGRAEEVRAGL
jgi:hypothetical protein